MNIAELIERLKMIKEFYGPNVDVRVKRITRASLEDLKNIGVIEASALHFNIDIEPALNSNSFDFSTRELGSSVENKTVNEPDTVTLTIT